MMLAMIIEECELKIGNSGHEGMTGRKISEAYLRVVTHTSIAIEVNFSNFDRSISSDVISRL